ncbi:glutamate--tRNA ligase [Candidatus Pacearchaeota archaeon]|nr:glutamate--tRNA ligase [Candidatus Pacearchaeota archaeon]
MRDYSKEIRAYVLKNALEFNKAEGGKVLPKLFQHGLQKEEIGEILPIMNRIVDDVNSLTTEEREKEYVRYKNYIKERDEKERTLPELPNSSGNMIFRVAPFPSGALHLGNAKTYLLNALYAEKYKARVLLIMDDTIGSKEKQISPESYNLIEEAFKWLNVKYVKPIIYKSDRLEIYYKYAEELIKKGKAYICHCSQEELREKREKEEECEHRDFSVTENLARWRLMSDAKEGRAILRLKTDMKDPDPAFRDRVLFRISDRDHPRVGKKYRIWPTLEMTWAVDDHLLGITHILRGNDLMIETDMEKYIWDIFGWKHPETIHTGLIRIEGIEGAKISKSKAQKEVKSGEFIGWDDPRTWSIQSLKRRGIKSEAIRELVFEIGLNKQDITVPIDSLYSINRKLIDSYSLRYSFVKDPIELEIFNKPKIKKISIQVHPDMKETRAVKIDKIFISKRDFEEFKGKEIRLLHLFNIKLIDEMKKDITKVEFTTVDNKEIPKINWVSVHVNVRVLMPDGNWLNGIAEKSVEKLKSGESIQFERFGFCRFDGKIKNKKGEEIYEFWFGHK